MTANQVWLDLLGRLTKYGEKSAPRGLPIRELRGFQTRVDMKYPCVTIARRIEGNYLAFMLAEPAWILSGSNRLDELTPYAPQMSRFSDDGRHLSGAYGPKILDQLTYVVETLINDPDSRQAVINIWRENPRATRDVPCTCSVQFLIRNGMLHVIDTMRSSDAWLGWPFDVFSFSMLAVMVILLLQEQVDKYTATNPRTRDQRYEKINVLQLGTLTLTAGSQHFYESNREKIEACLADGRYNFEPGPLNPVMIPQGSNGKGGLTSQADELVTLLDADAENIMRNPGGDFSLGWMK